MYINNDCNKLFLIYRLSFVLFFSTLLCIVTQCVKYSNEVKIQRCISLQRSSSNIANHIRGLTSYNFCNLRDAPDESTRVTQFLNYTCTKINHSTNSFCTCDTNGNICVVFVLLFHLKKKRRNQRLITIIIIKKERKMKKTTHICCIVKISRLERIILNSNNYYITMRFIYAEA